MPPASVREPPGEGGTSPRGPEVGDVVGAKYRVEAILGEGGMGIVARATHLQLDEPVALKFLRPDLARNADIVARFAREAKASARVKSEHIARVYDVGMRDDGVPYMVMELLQGTDLGTMVSREGPLPLEDAVDYIVQACEALAQAHASGIVHRDIKPENLFLVGAEGWRTIKLLDFGISHSGLIGNAGDADPDTNPSLLLGTPLYMSPEQVRASKTVDGRSDVWSLGICLYELLTGEHAFGGPGVQEICAAILDAPAPLISHNRPDLPIELEAVIARCLEKDPDLRYPNVAELALALADFASPRSRISAERSAHVIRTAGLASTGSEGPGAGEAGRAAPSVRDAIRAKESARESARADDAPASAPPVPSLPRPPLLPTPGTFRPSVAFETPTLTEPIPVTPLPPRSEDPAAGASSVRGGRASKSSATVLLVTAGILVTAGAGIWIGRTTAGASAERSNASASSAVPVASIASLTAAAPGERSEAASTGAVKPAPADSAPPRSPIPLRGAQPSAPGASAAPSARPPSLRRRSPHPASSASASASSSAPAASTSAAPALPDLAPSPSSSAPPPSSWSSDPRLSPLPP